MAVGKAGEEYLVCNVDRIVFEPDLTGCLSIILELKIKMWMKLD